MQDDSVTLSNAIQELKSRLSQVSRAWTAADYREFLNLFIEMLPRVFQAERCTVFIREPGRERICSLFGTGLEEREIEPPPDDSIVGRVIASGEPAVENELQSRRGFHKRVDEEMGFTTRSILCVPIVSATGYGVTGAVQILNKRGAGGFGRGDLEMLKRVARHLSQSIENILLSEEIVRLSEQLQEKVESFGQGHFPHQPFIAESGAMRSILQQVRMLGQTPVNVHLYGEHGTGKELLARMIHEGENNRSGPLVAVNCASIPENLMESEFFGYEKGAFTGADRSRPGYFEQAKGGTLFLDEIAEMPLHIQPKFLRVLQESEGRRLGGSRDIQYDFRVICASNKDLKQEVREGRFREDLYFRLFSVELYVPPLRERTEDIAPLALAFLEETSRRFGKKPAGFAPEVMDRFRAYHWPGNIRQIRQEIERLVALTPDGEPIVPETLSPELRNQPLPGAEREEGAQDFDLHSCVRSLEKRMIREALLKTGNNRQKTADLLGITRQGLLKKINRYNIEISNERKQRFH
jgi:transcriptional regulator with GAF, ATPase, and Fis domain